MERLTRPARRVRGDDDRPQLSPSRKSLVWTRDDARHTFEPVPLLLVSDRLTYVGVGPDAGSGPTVCYSLLGPGEETGVAVAGRAGMGKSLRVRRVAAILRARISSARLDVLPVGLRLT